MQAIAVCVCGACVGMPSALSILSTECGGYIEYWVLSMVETLSTEYGEYIEYWVWSSTEHAWWICIHYSMPNLN
jgi:hypothetical protein